MIVFTVNEMLVVNKCSLDWMLCWSFTEVKGHFRPLYYQKFPHIYCILTSRLTSTVYISPDDNKAVVV